MKEYILISILEGSATPEDYKSFREWYDASDANRKEFDSLKAIWQATETGHASVSSDQAWEKVKEKTINKKSKVIFFTPMRIAATIIVLITLGAIFYTGFNHNINYVTLALPEKSNEVELPDASHLKFKEKPTVEIAQNFESERYLKLNTGEAFFDVRPDKEKPFKVYTPELTVEVLGTSFIINENVEVLEGKVKVTVNDTKEIVFLHPYEKVSLENGQLNKTTITDMNHFASYTKKLKFSDANLTYVVETLEDYYQVDIKGEEKLKDNCVYTGTFQNPDMEETFEIISISTNVKIENVNGQYVISGEGCE